MTNNKYLTLSGLYFGAVNAVFLAVFTTLLILLEYKNYAMYTLMAYIGLSIFGIVLFGRKTGKVTIEILEEKYVNLFAFWSNLIVYGIIFWAITFSTLVIWLYYVWSNM